MTAPVCIVKIDRHARGLSQGLNKENMLLLAPSTIKNHAFACGQLVSILAAEDSAGSESCSAASQMHGVQQSPSQSRAFTLCRVWVSNRLEDAAKKKKKTPSKKTKASPSPGGHKNNAVPLARIQVFGASSSFLPAGTLICVVPLTCALGTSAVASELPVAKAPPHTHTVPVRMAVSVRLELVDVLSSRAPASGSSSPTVRSPVASLQKQRSQASSISPASPTLSGPTPILRLSSQIRAIVGDRMRESIICRGMHICLTLSGAARLFHISSIVGATTAEMKDHKDHSDTDTDCGCESDELRPVAYFVGKSCRITVGRQSCTASSKAELKQDSMKLKLDQDIVAKKLAWTDDNVVERENEEDLSALSSKVASLSVTSTSASSLDSDKDGGQHAFRHIGGLDQEVALISSHALYRLRYSIELSRMLGAAPTRGILLHGPPGTGKTMLVQALAEHCQATFLVVDGSQLMTAYVGDGERRLESVFRQAYNHQPAIIFIDEIDGFCATRGEETQKINDGGALRRRLTASLLSLLDDNSMFLTSVEADLDRNDEETRGFGLDRVLVVAATNRLDSLDNALRRPGRFDVEVEIGIPNVQGRLDILMRTFGVVPSTRHSPSSSRNTSQSVPVSSSLRHALTETDLQRLASLCHGYVGADLRALVTDAALLTLQRVTEEVESRGGLSQTACSVDARIIMEDMLRAYATFRPSAMRHSRLEVPKVKWSDIGGQALIKQKLREAVEWPLVNPQAFVRMNIRPPQGILLYGPPGCSKTMLAKAVACECSQNFIAIKGPELLSKWVGESEKAIRTVFRRARAAAPSIVFFDEIDSIASKRGGGDSDAAHVSDRILSQLLTELDGLTPLRQVTVIAATNRPDMLDPALLRPGRIDRMLYVAPPDAGACADIYKLLLREVALHEDVNVSLMAGMSVGLSGAELAAVCRDAGLLAMTDSPHASCVTMVHFVHAIAERQKRRNITPAMTEFYEGFAQSRQNL